MPDRRLTLAQLLPALGGGGVERGTLEVAAEAVRLGHRSIVISAGGGMVDALVSGGSEHYAWPIGRKSLLTLGLAYRLRRWLEAERVDILHARSRVPAWVAWLAWRGMPPGKRPHFVTTVHGLYSVNRYSRIMTRGERVIAVSDTARRYILENYPEVDPGVIRVIPRGVDRREFPYRYSPDAEWLTRWRTEFPFLQGRRVLTLPGRITRLKGHHDFVTLIAALCRSGHDVHGLIVGGEDRRRQAYAAELRERIVREGLADRVTFTGQRRDVREVYAISDLVLSLSTQPESFGRTTLEALSIGVPVVGYDHGGVGEVLNAMYPSGRVPLGDADALVDACRRHLENAPPVPESHPFLLERMLSSTFSLYQSLGAC